MERFPKTLVVFGICGLLCFIALAITFGNNYSQDYSGASHGIIHSRGVVWMPPASVNPEENCPKCPEAQACPQCPEANKCPKCPKAKECPKPAKEDERGDSPIRFSRDEEVDFRINVIVFDRAESLRKCLVSIEHLVIDKGEKVWLDVHIDVDKDGLVKHEVLRVAAGFNRTDIKLNIYVQKRHMSIQGQWLTAWQPHPASKEIGIILEEDVDIAPYGWKWLKAAHEKYHMRKDILGFSIYEGEMLQFHAPTDVKVFMHRRFGAQAFCPLAKHWAAFTKWNLQMLKDKNFHPYVSEDAKLNNLYQDFERQGFQWSMWEMYLLYYSKDHDLYTVYPNTAAYMHARHPEMFNNDTVYFAKHRQERGLHFKKSNGVPSEGHLIQHWHDEYISFPDKLKKYNYNKSFMSETRRRRRR